MPQATENNKPGGEGAPNSKGQGKPLEGAQLDEALLEKVVSDDAPGEAAAVLREVARLHQENRTLKTQINSPHSHAVRLLRATKETIQTQSWFFL